VQHFMVQSIGTKCADPVLMVGSKAVMWLFKNKCPAVVRLPDASTMTVIVRGLM
jgi:hypothetical protein